MRPFAPTLLALLTVFAAPGCTPAPPQPEPTGTGAMGADRPAERAPRTSREARDPRPTTPAPAASDATGAAFGTATPATVPARFVGTWAADEGDCDDPAAESRLEIGAGHLAFHESRGPVLRVDATGAHLVVLVALAGEGETRGARHAFALTPDGSRLADLATGFARRRCDATRPSERDGPGAPFPSSRSAAPSSTGGAAARASGDSGGE